MKYILQPHISPVGYMDKKYAMFDSREHITHFLDKERFSILLRCSGKTDMELSGLPEREAAFLQWLLQNGFVAETTDGEVREVFRDYRYYANPSYRGVEWSITGACNSKCRHCFMSARYGRYGNIPTEKCLEICRQLGECGIREVTLTGGEPLLRKDFLNIVDGLTVNGVLISAILTNGTLLCKELLEGLRERKLHPLFQLSYDGVGHHDWMRGVDGAEEKVLQAIDMLKQYGFIVAVTMCLNRRNQYTIFDTLQVCLKHGVDYFRVFQARAEGEFLNYPEELLPYEEALQRFVECIPQIVRAKVPIPVQLDTVLELMPNGNGYRLLYNSQLPPGKKKLGLRMKEDFYLAPRGACLPRFGMLTPETEKKYPNVFQTPLQRILSGKEYNDLAICRIEDYLKRNPECENCEHFRHCIMQWSGSGVVKNSGDLYRKNLEFCLYMKNGWEKKLETAYKESKTEPSDGST